MEREAVERLKEEMKPVMERGRRMFGKEIYDNHIRDWLLYFDIDPNDKYAKEIFDL